MDKKLEEALNNVDVSYHELVEIADESISPLTADADAIMKNVRENVSSMSVDQLRDYMLRLQMEAYRLSEIREKSQLKADLAETLMKEKYAITFNSLDGSAAVKDKLTQAEVSKEVVAENVYNLMASLLKTKVDALHRMVDVLKSILMSRMQEAKLMNQGIADDVNSYKSKTRLNEGDQF